MSLAVLPSKDALESGRLHLLHLFFLISLINHDFIDPESMKAKDFSSKPESLSEQKVWKGYDAEDVNLLFSIVYRAIFKENVFSSPNGK